MPLSSKPKVGNRTAVTVSFSDSIRLIRDEVQWTPKGVRLLTKWPFGEGAEVEFAFDHDGERHCCVGVVVGCRPLARHPGFFETVLFFLETPCTRLQKAACDCRLAPHEHVPQDETHFTVTGATAPRSRGRSGPRVGAPHRDGKIG